MHDEYACLVFSTLGFLAYLVTSSILVELYTRYWAYKSSLRILFKPGGVILLVLIGPFFILYNIVRRLRKSCARSP